MAKESIELINDIRDLDPNLRIERLKHLSTLLTETLKRGEEKVALAKTTFDAVSMEKPFFFHFSLFRKRGENHKHTFVYVKMVFLKFVLVYFCFI